MKWRNVCVRCAQAVACLTMLDAYWKQREEEEEKSSAIEKYKQKYTKQIT